MYKDLGRILGKEEQKKIKGATGGEPSQCKTDEYCTYYESGTGMVDGYCANNSKYQCVCIGPNSSVVWDACETND
jgi:hypothetical protein